MRRRKLKSRAVAERTGFTLEGMLRNDSVSADGKCFTEYMCLCENKEIMLSPITWKSMLALTAGS